MHEYMLDISDSSVWRTATPTSAVCAFPFYVTEAGCFFARTSYFTERSGYDSYMLLYTIDGRGKMQTEDSEFTLAKGSAVIVNCRNRHSYRTDGNGWSFLWMHIKGTGIPSLFDVLYPSAVHPIDVYDSNAFSALMNGVIENTGAGDIVTASQTSADIHSIFNMLIRCVLRAVEENQKGNRRADIDRAVSYIEKNYSGEITIDDIVNSIHISKYHFIRLFKRIIGVTPYAYLMSCRINRSKLLLRTTDMSIGDIALACGFADTSNFIVRFKKHTGQKPTGYRAAFR